MNTKKVPIQDAVMLGSWEEVKSLPLSSITKKDADNTTQLDGLILKGYETKFGVTNENGEQYAPGCLDEFIQDYFIDKGLNMVVDVQHGYGVDEQIGRVIYLEVNTVGFYFVVYIPCTVKRYEQIRDLLKEGILQGFSKCGWATDGNYHYNEDGSFDYFEITRMEILSVSLVTAPANAIPFEDAAEIRNSLSFRNLVAEEAQRRNVINKNSIFKH